MALGLKPGATMDLNQLSEQLRAGVVTPAMEKLRGDTDT